MKCFRRHPPSAIRHSPSRRGFTLIEAALTTVIVGTGVLAIMAAQQAYHMKNDWAQRTGTAQHLANELRELTIGMPMHDPISGDANLGPESDEADVADYDDLDDFAGTVVDGSGTGTTFDPPINALRNEIADMDNWRQVIEVEGVWSDKIDDSSEFTPALNAKEPTSGEYSLYYRMTVTVQYRDPSRTPVEYRTVTDLTWVVPE